MSELVAAEQWLTTVLTGDSTLSASVGLRVYGHIVPEGTAYPYIWITNQAATDVMGVGPARILTNTLYAVRAVVQDTTFVNLNTLADRIDTVLHAASGTVAAGTVMACVRVRPFVMVEPVGGVQYRHLGGIYRLLVQ